MLKLNYNLEKEHRKNISRHITNNSNSENRAPATIFNKHMNYYVCSYGGSGSTILSEYLKQFGNVYHIHDRYPPNKLCYVGNENNNTNEDVYREWFNSVEIPEDKISNYKVIFIYRNPIEAIFSRFVKPNGPHKTHLQNIKCQNNGDIWLNDLVLTKKDLYGLEEFFDNYTSKKPRNYDILCVKYEDLFENWSRFNSALGIPDFKQLYPIKSERKKQYAYLVQLNMIYYNLILKMRKMNFIEKIIVDEKCNV